MYKQAAVYCNYSPSEFDTLQQWRRDEAVAIYMAQREIDAMNSYYEAEEIKNANK